MREKYIIGFLDRRTISSECLADLKALAPEGYSNNLFRVEGWKTDDHIQGVLARLKQQGLAPVSSLLSDREHFPLRIERHFNRKDLENSVLLQFVPRKVVTEVAEVSATGQVSVSASCLDEDLNIFALDMEVYAVTAEVKAQIIAAGLLHVTFEPVEVTGRGADKWLGKIWQLSSDLKLPKLSPKCKLVYPGRGGGPFDGDYSRWVMVEEEFYRPAELHYRASDLANMERFDLACPFERMNCYPYEKTLIASQQFYRFCRDRGYRLSWWPVCIDPD